MRIGIKLKEFRLNRKLSQNDLGQMIGVSKQAISMYERGERLPDAETLVSLSKALNVDVDTLLGVKNNDPIEVISDSEKMLLDLFRSASPYQQEIILQLLATKIMPL